MPRARASPASLHCGPWARHIYPSLLLVQPKKTRPCLTERLLMNCKESNQTNKQTNPLYISNVITSKKYSISFSEDPFSLSKQCRPWIQCHIMPHFIWVFTVCQSTHLGVSSVHVTGIWGGKLTGWGINWLVNSFTGGKNWQLHWYTKDYVIEKTSCGHLLYMYM